MALLDVLSSFAEVTVSSPGVYVRPTLKEKGSGIMDLKACRHPCMEAMDGVSFIPNDVRMERGVSTLSLVTGPNMGGKSTFLRQTALAVLMAQIGCFVACESATVSLVDSIYTRVGAADDQTKGISTFMAEMLDSSVILEGATADSLVIVDELGRGTSTYDGFGLAWAIAQYLVKEIRCFSLFATHFHELTALGDQVPDVQNLKVLASTEGGQLTLLHKVEPGISERSFGINVAELVKFRQSVINEARTKLHALEAGVRNHDLFQDLNAACKSGDAESLRKLLHRAKGLMENM